MALEGNLTAFGLSEILQLIAVQQKTGMLTVTNTGSTTVMFFRDGQIISTRDRRRKTQDSFRDYLTRYGVLSHEELVRVAQISSQSKLDLTDILASEKFLSQVELEKHWHKSIQEEMHEVLTWEEGTYKFISTQEIVDGIKTLSAYNVEGMLMEAMRRIDEFPRMLEMFPSDQITVTLRENSAEGLELIQNERDVLARIDGSTSIRKLISCSRMPVFEVYEAVKLLQDKGLVKTEEIAIAREDDGDGDDTQRKKRRSRPNPLPFMVAVVAFAAASFVGLRGVYSSFVPDQPLSVELVRDEQMTRAHVEHRLRWLIEAHNALYGSYPASLSALRSTGLASEQFLERAQSLEFRYRLTHGQSAYTLL